MTATIACLRCGKLSAVEAEDDDGRLLDVAGVDVADGGMLTQVCVDCLTHDEAVDKARRSASAVLDAAEEAIANIEMVWGRVPALKDDPDVQAQYADAQAKAERMRAVLNDLTGGE